MRSETPRAATTPSRTAATDFLADGYLAHLLSYSLDTLSKEPSTLKSQEDALRAELADTAKANYQGFIEAASCFHDFSAQVSQVQEQLQHLAGSLQELQSQSVAYVATARSYQVRCPCPPPAKRHASTAPTSKTSHTSAKQQLLRCCRAHQSRNESQRGRHTRATRAGAARAQPRPACTARRAARAARGAAAHRDVRAQRQLRRGSRPHCRRR